MDLDKEGYLQWQGAHKIFLKGKLLLG